MTEGDDANELMIKAIVRRDVHGLTEALRQGANPNGNPAHPIRPLHAAAVKGPVESVDALLRHGADPRAQDEEGRTPLHSLSMADCPEAEWTGIARRLLEAGADVNARDTHGRMPLDDAASTQRVELARALIQAGGTCGKRYHSWIRSVAPDAAAFRERHGR